MRQQVERAPGVLVAGLFLARHTGVALKDHLDRRRVEGVALHHLLAIVVVVADADVGVDGPVLVQVSLDHPLSGRAIDLLDQPVEHHLAPVGRLGQVLEEGVVPSDDVVDARFQHQQGQEDERPITGIAGELAQVLEERDVGLSLVGIADGHKPALDLVDDEEGAPPGDGFA